MLKIKEEIINGCLQKERSAQKALYQLLLPYLKPIVSRYLRNNQYVLDVLQESFVKIFTNIEEFSAEKGRLESWAAKIAINRSINYNNRIIGINTLEINETQLSESIDLDDENTYDKKALELILQKMPRGYFEVFNLYVIDGYDHNEIGQILDIDPSLSRKKLSRAREWFKKANLVKKIVVLFLLIMTL